MIIYNITCKVDWTIHPDWYHWVHASFIPGMLATGLFSQGQVLKLLELDDTEGPTYALQFRAASLDDYQRFMRDIKWVPLRREQNRWNDAVVFFGSVMQIME